LAVVAVAALMTIAIALPVTAAPGGGSGGGQGGHGTTTTTTTAPTTTTTMSPTTTTTSSVVPALSVPSDTSKYHFCVAVVHCSLTSQGGTLTWSSGGPPGYWFAIWVWRDHAEVASSDDRSGSMATEPGDDVYATAGYCQYGIHTCREGEFGPSNTGYVLLVNP
jgi:hypothetical protein